MSEYVKKINEKNAQPARMGLPSIPINPYRRRAIPMTFPANHTINQKAKGNRYDDDFKEDVRRMYLLATRLRVLAKKKVFPYNQQNIGCIGSRP